MLPAPLFVLFLLCSALHLNGYLDSEIIASILARTFAHG